jgi:hypothetical protein
MVAECEPNECTKSDSHETGIEYLKDELMSLKPAVEQNYLILYKGIK